MSLRPCWCRSTRTLSALIAMPVCCAKYPARSGQVQVDCSRPYQRGSWRTVATSRCSYSSFQRRGRPSRCWVTKAPNPPNSNRSTQRWTVLWSTRKSSATLGTRSPSARSSTPWHRLTSSASELLRYDSANAVCSSTVNPRAKRLVIQHLQRAFPNPIRPLEPQHQNSHNFYESH